MAHFVGTPEMESRNCPGWTPGNLNSHNSSPQARIGTSPESKLQLSSRTFQRHVALFKATSGRGRFPTFSGRESNCQFDSRPFFCPQFGLQMSEWPMRGHFRYLRFKTFPMTPRTPQCEVFWALLLSSKHSGVPADSKPPTFPSVGLHPHTWPKWGCDTLGFKVHAYLALGPKTYAYLALSCSQFGILYLCIPLNMFHTSSSILGVFI